MSWNIVRQEKPCPTKGWRVWCCLARGLVSWSVNWCFVGEGVVWSNKFEEHGNKQSYKAFATRPFEAFTMLRCIVSSEKEKENVYVSRAYFSWIISWDQHCKEYTLRNFGLKSSYCSGCKGAAFLAEKLPKGMSSDLELWARLKWHSGKEGGSWFKGPRNTSCPSIFLWSAGKFLWVESRSGLGATASRNFCWSTNTELLAWWQYLVCIHSCIHSTPTELNYWVPAVCQVLV